ncbi:hypothetical protein ACRALDRAFT_2056060 [Sodiomyces alcalophilus JCM 7366]|uniref:uncharacterized protein n=1 Tax=Sodiomyces alcalophilus JCM 7366 TaxID=591952 RepID=UPI0039B428ED
MNLMLRYPQTLRRGWGSSRKLASQTEREPLKMRLAICPFPIERVVPSPNMRHMLYYATGAFPVSTQST